MAFNYSDLMGLVTDDPFEERPVDIEEFVNSPEYLGLKPLSKFQYQLIRASSQIYRKDTLELLYAGEPEKAEKRWNETKKEIVFQLGKGSGKDYSSSIACAYVVYLLMCLKDPADYYGKPAGEQIAILNVAINSDQAKNVFFKHFKQKITKSEWFSGKYRESASEFEFQKNIFVYSGHSEREAWEGYNFILVILDEISGFALESTTGREQSKTAPAVHLMYKQSVLSRFPQFGKILLLSFPRFKNDYIQQVYEKSIAEKEVIRRTHTFKIDNALADGIDSNEFTVEWEEDHIITYTRPGVFALKRPTWDVNPISHLEDFKEAFYDDPIDTLARFACMPPDAEGAFFKSREKIEAAFQTENGVDENGVFKDFFSSNPTKDYYVHVDLARLHDRCAVAMAHVDHWEKRKFGNIYSQPSPIVVVDAVRYWTPTKTKNVDFGEVRDYIVSLRHRGFNIKLVTFDRWESFDMIEYLRGVGMKSETLSVSLNHYTDLQAVISEERLIGPKINILMEELLQLKIMPNGKIDHPRSGGKDLADAVCGAVSNAIAYSRRESGEGIEILDLSTVRRLAMEEKIENEVVPAHKSKIIRKPSDWNQTVPSDILEFMRVI